VCPAAGRPRRVTGFHGREADNHGAGALRRLRERISADGQALAPGPRHTVAGSSIENEDNLRFAVQQGISAMIEEVPLDDAPAAYDRMMSGAARFRMVLNIASLSAGSPQSPAPSQQE
jgi:hypothetical protein